MSKEVRKAVAYLRTSSRANVGADEDSDKRQRAAIEAYARAAGYEIVETFDDAAVSAADPVGDRPGFAEMLERLLSNGARTIIVASPDRFARDLMAQLAAYHALKARGITLVAASAPTHFVEDTPDRDPRAPGVGRGRRVREDDPRRQAGGGAQAQANGDGREGRGAQGHVETRPDLVKLAKVLARRKPKGGRLSLRAIAAEMAAQGFLNERGQPFNPKSIAAMLATRTRLGNES
ncbi:MAG TPA: recombinase family protein [Roseiarcus sp.]|nr:recombinase family protein [Roseiarcus sp.]